ncbi:MAG TPA: hypothetical protein VF189_03200 [Patescibacteria group bacterium]
MWFFGKPISKKKVSHFEDLKEKWSQKHRVLQKQLWDKHGSVLKEFAEKTRHATLGSLAGIVLLTSPGISAASSIPQIPKDSQYADLGQTSTFLLNLNANVPQDVRPLTPEEEQKIGDVLSQSFGMKVSSELDGIKLNRSYGYIGQEQHLMRYPGDTMDTHLASQADVESYYKYGMAPGRGAWGYFANSSTSMTNQDINREKYYIAVQTFLAPGYLENTRQMSQFFKYRKMLVVNPQNGRAVVADIADSGPSEWTGKSLGGSPEVMNYLQRVDGAQKGAVLYFFIDDPNDTIPLGPVELKSS